MLNFHSETIKNVLESLKTSLDGLSLTEIDKRQKKYGENKLSEKKRIGKFSIFVSQFQNSLIYILLITGALSFFIGAEKEAVVIAGAVVINAVLGFFQENKANQALQKLKKLSEHTAIVVREGREREISSKEIVVGDIIVLKAGNRVPSDLRIIEASELQINESSLTGESIPEKKGTDKISTGASLADRTNMSYAGSIIVHGHGKAVATAIGHDTEIGKIAKLVSDTREEKTPLQLRLEKLSKMFGLLFAVICIFIISIGLFQNRDFFEILETAVAVGVASIPEGLTIAITFILALGMQNILKKKALIRKLVATETLGSVSVICMDKTGTLTKGEMSVDHIVIGEKEFELASQGSRQNETEAKMVSLALQTAMMCNDASIENPDQALSDWKFIGTPTEVALLSAAMQSGLRQEELLKNEIQVAELPFDSDKKYMLSLHSFGDSSYVLYEKGAPEILLDKASHYYHQGELKALEHKEKQKLIKNYEKMTARGLRVIGVAIKRFKYQEGELDNNNLNWADIDKDINFIGFIAIKDPLRHEAKSTIESAISAGIRPIIITGDHRLTAKAIASEVGLKVKDENIIIGKELENISDQDLKKLVSKIDIYARVSPHHKLRIVKALQSMSEVVAMTGDGINDAPALKAADIGISLGTGTDVAKETSDMVLLDSNFKTIIAAVKQGRIIFRNVQKVITYLISDSFSEMILVVGSLLLGTPLAVLPAQILWINIVNDGVPHFSLGFESADKYIMRKKPIAKNEPLINKEMKWIIFGVGIFRDLLLFGVFYCLYLNWKHNPELIPLLQTIIFATLGVKSLMSIFSLRHFHLPIWKYNPFSNKILVMAVAISFSLLYLSVEWPPLQSLLSTVGLKPSEWAIAFLVGFIGVGLTELVKLKFISPKAFYKK